MFGLDIDDLLDSADVFTSPLHKPSMPGTFDWSEIAMPSAMSMPGYEAPARSTPITEFGMGDQTFSELLNAFDLSLAMPTTKAAPPIPIITPPKTKKQKLLSFGPSVLRPFASFESTELAVEQLRSTFRRTEQRMTLARQKAAGKAAF
jgi:hypothetical protein